MISEDWKSLFESRILTRGAFPRKQCIVSTYHTFAIKKKPPLRVLFLYGIRCIMELEESGPPNRRVKKCPVDTFLARGRVPLSTPDKLPDLDTIGVR